MRGTRQEQKGAAGSHEVAGKFERLGWGVAVNPDHDLGTDLYLAPREKRLVDLAMMAGAQVKTGNVSDPGKYFRNPKRDKAGNIIGWWYRESSRKHFDYWVNHRVPHLLVLHDLDTWVSYWVHVTEEQVHYLKKGAKIFVPADQTIDADHAQALLEVATKQNSQTTWEGSSWTGAANQSPTHLYRHALLVPRLVAPHPNRSVARLSGAEAIALLVLGREPRYRAGMGAEVTLDAVDASSPWEWQLASGLRRYIRRSDRLGLAAALDSAAEPHQQAASGVAMALAHLEADDIAAAAEVLDAILGGDQLEAVDHAWLSLHRAWTHFEAGEVDLAREESLRLLGFSSQAPHDLTATAISGAAANLLFATSDWDSLDFAETVAATDTTVSWWRQQVLGWGRGQRVEDEFKRWAHDTTSQYRATDAWDHTRAASLIAGFLGDRGAWRSALNELTQHMLIISQEYGDEEVVDQALRTQRTVGAHKELALAANWLIANGPVDAVKHVADDVHPDESTVSTLQADLALLTAAGDILEPSHAESVAQWGMRAFNSPESLIRLAPQFNVQREVTNLLASLSTALPLECQSSILRWAIAARPEHPGLVAQHMRKLIVSLSDDVWDSAMAELAAYCADEHADAVKYALLQGARPYIDDVQDRLIAEAMRDDGSAEATWALGSVAEFSDELVVVLRDRASSVLQTRPLKGISIGGSDRQADALALLNLSHPHLAKWEPVVEWLSRADTDSDIAPVLQRIFRYVDELPEDVTSRLAGVVRQLQTLRPDPGTRRTNQREFKFAAVALGLAIEHRESGVLSLAPITKLAAGDRNARQLAALLCGNEDPRTDGILAVLMADNDPYVRATTASVLVHRVARGEDHLLSQVQASLDDRGTAVARFAANEFAGYPSQALASAFEPLKTHASGEVRERTRAGLRAWGRVHGPEFLGRSEPSE